MARGTANTRMRDFYDIHVILEREKDFIVVEDLCNAFLATCQKRNTFHMIPLFNEILNEIHKSDSMEKYWINYRDNNFMESNLTWNDVFHSTSELATLILNTQEMVLIEEEQEELGLSIM